MKSKTIQRIFVIGDIHGCSKTFSKLLKDKLHAVKDDHIYLLGDYIDRGPRSREVISKILRLTDKGWHIYPIMGNHEIMLLHAFRFPSDLRSWMRNGGKATLDSFGVNSPEKIGIKFLDFFMSLPYYYKLPKYIIVHGGLNFKLDNPLQDKDAMAWERNKEVFPEKLGGRKIIVGHTPRTLEQIRKSLTTDKIMLDGGCVYYKTYGELGYLCALELNTMKLYTQLNVDF